jgi:signal transduction histidine kinase
VPLLYEGRLLGALGIAACTPGARFTDDDVQTLELLAGIAAAVLVGSEQARLNGALLATRTMQHELNNKLALAVGYAELLALSPELSPRLREQATEALRGATEASAVLEQLRRLVRIQERQWGALLETTIDLAGAGTS